VSEPRLHEGRQVEILLPWYREVAPQVAWSVMRLIDKSRIGIRARWGDAAVWHTRNVLAEEFLRSGVEWSFWVDGDEILPTGDAKLFNSVARMRLPDAFAGLNILDRLLSHGKTLVGAVYWGRYEGSKPIYAEAMTSEKEDAYARKGPYDLIKPTAWVGFGAVLVHRSVFLDIEERYPHLARDPQTGSGGNWFSPNEQDLRRSFDSIHEILGENLNSEIKLAKIQAAYDSAMRQAKKNPVGAGEDVSFCQRAAACGHTPHVDMALYCGHLGDRVYGKNT
jgi:uncharacterized protein YacL (UPF0231 family)